MHSTHTSTRQRTPKARLSPALAHQMDILRASAMGIDISYMAPDERCKYPSKFCCNVRTRKSTGKLHRFCEYHCSRAQINQTRWVEFRRKQEAAGEETEASRAGESSRRQQPRLEWGHASSSTFAFYQIPDPTPIDTNQSTKVADLSDQEVNVLLALLSDGEQLMETSASPVTSDFVSVSPPLWDAELTCMDWSSFQDIYIN